MIRANMTRRIKITTRAVIRSVALSASLQVKPHLVCLKAEVIRSPDGGARLPSSEFAPCSGDTSIYCYFPPPPPGVVFVVEDIGLKLC